MKKGTFFELFLPCLFSAFTLCFFAPIEFYYGNVSNVWYDLPDILPFIIVTFSLAIVVVLAISILLKRLGNLPYRIFSWCLIILTICLYIQGNFMPSKFDKLGDETINWANYDADGYSSMLVLVGIILLIIALMLKVDREKYEYFFKIAMICILLVQLVTIVIITITKGNLNNNSKYIATTEKEYTYSDKENLIVIVLDAFDSRIMTDLLEADEKKYAGLFEDFTFYENTLGTFGLTDFSIPHILTGEKYLNQCTYGEYANDAYLKSPLLQTLKENNYDMGIYTTVTLPQGEAAEWFDNWHKIDYSVKDKVQFFRDYYRILAFRYLPYCFKRAVYYDVDEMDSYRCIVSVDGKRELADETEVFPWGNIEFYENIPEITAGVENPAFRFIHLKGVHSYRNLYSDMKIHRKEMELTVNEEGEVVAKILSDYLDKLKKEEIYDKSAIVIMADHGAIAYPVGGKSQTPLLMVKGFNEKHALEISHAPISYDDMQICFSRLLQKKTGSELFDAKEGENRTRYIYFTHYTGALNSKSKNGKFTENSIDGPANDSSGLKETGVVFD